jgi:hypothetical protein
MSVISQPDLFRIDPILKHIECPRRLRLSRVLMSKGVKIYQILRPPFSFPIYMHVDQTTGS